ncbi:MAG TPA: penicillin-binding transpeptidase domain-containing protein [Solirubrobacteraceae bacterium]|nr:penicillin-binding transpeptidase domain-containing protein [Solirubrobacteraceae bacterium]
MNAPILKLFGLVLVLFAALIAMTSWNSVINAKEYRENTLNARPQLEQQRVHRGAIRARDDSLLARSVKGSDELYRRRYAPEAQLFAHVIGYDFLRIARAGLERSRNDALAGERNELTSIVDELRGRRREGDNVVTNLDPGAQRVARDALEGRKGSVVAIEPATGKVRVMVSTPGYDLNSLDEPGVYEKLSRDGDNSPLLNRATQGGYVPGSTMKVVTATAALDSGDFTPESRVSGKSPINISGAPLNNFSNEQFGNITLTEALTNSVNTVWGQVAERLGNDTMDDYMERFGFESDPPMDYPDGQMLPSGVYDKGKVLSASSKRVDIGRVGIGQERLRVTPLQMATVAATVANGGMRMKSQIASRIVDVDGRTIERIEPEEAQRVMSEETASQLTQMMSNVVREGTGTAAALEGIEVAGKTGTAELNIPQRLNQPWFIGFAPRQSPKVAIAVTLENIVGGQGGVVAAPIAKQVMQELLR